MERRGLSAGRCGGVDDVGLHSQIKTTGAILNEELDVERESHPSLGCKESVWRAAGTCLEV